MRTILIKTEHSFKGIKDFIPERFFFGTRSDTGTHYIGCHYSYGGGIHRGHAMIAKTPVNLSGTHKVIGFDETMTYLKVRELNIKKVII